MSLSAHKIKALFQKDIKDALKNSQSMIMVVLPILFTLLYRYISLGGEHMDQSFVMATGLLMNLSLIPISAMSMMIAEEKEKNTLRTLMLSNVSAGEFLISKALVIYLITQSVGLVIYFLSGAGAVSFIRFFFGTSFTCLCLMFFGAIIGIVSKNQMATGTMSAPFAMLLLIPAIFGQVDEGFAKYARFTPTYAMLQILGKEGSLWFPLAVLLAWAILAALLFSVIYRKKRLD